MANGSSATWAAYLKMEPSLRRVGSASLALFAFGLAVTLRLRQASQPMTFDEYASLYFSSRPFSDLWGWWMLRETNPPLFYSILKGWRVIAPDTQAGLRALPFLFSMTQIAVLARFVLKTYGWPSAVLSILLLALSPSDIFQSEYVRGYVLAKLAITVSFIGLAFAVEGGKRAKLGWTAYAVGAVIAIYSHTTMLVWPLIATAALVIDAALRRELRSLPFARLVVANLAIYTLSTWSLVVALAQLRTRAQNIAWIEPLSIADFAASLKLQLLLDGASSSALMVLLMIIGMFRTWSNRVTRFVFIAATLTVLAFKTADAIHPIISDYTMHWAAIFSTLLAAAALARKPSTVSVRKGGLAGVGAAVSIAVLVGLGVLELSQNVWMPLPQDWRYTVRTVARDRGAGLLVSHESVGLVVKQACMLEFQDRSCPFRLIVMQNPAASDSWAVGGYGAPLTPASRVRAALAGLKTVYAFSRYVYTPLEPLGLDPGDYKEVQWDDGELVGPIPADAFAKCCSGNLELGTSQEGSKPGP